MEMCFLFLHLVAAYTRWLAHIKCSCIGGGSWRRGTGVIGSTVPAGGWDDSINVPARRLDRRLPVTVAAPSGPATATVKIRRDSGEPSIKIYTIRSSNNLATTSQWLLSPKSRVKIGLIPPPPSWSFLPLHFHQLPTKTFRAKCSADVKMH